MPSVLTANRLTTGEVVYLAEGDRWVERLAEARAATSDVERAEIETAAARHAAANAVVGAYLMDVRLSCRGIEPASMREAIRARRGPTI